MAQDNPDIEVVGPDARTEQAQLFNACFKKRLERADLEWRYDANPHGVAVTLLARDPSGDPISGYACNPRRALVRGDESTLAVIGETGDVMTHPEHRGKGVFSSLDATAMAETARLGWAGVFGLPNRRSAPIFVKIGWDQVGLIRPYTFVLRAGREARAERFKEGRLAAWLSGAVAKRGQHALTKLERDAGAAFRVRRLERFPAEVEDLSKRVERDFDLMVRRDAAYLNWRFIDNRSGLHRAYGVFDPQDRLHGYVVIQVPDEGSSIGHLVDVLAPEPSALDAALAAGLTQLRERGAAVARASAIDGSWWERQLRRAGFAAPKPDNHLIVIFYTHDAAHPLAAVGQDASRWYLTDGDRDDETVG